MKNLNLMSHYKSEILNRKQNKDKTSISSESCKKKPESPKMKEIIQLTKVDKQTVSQLVLDQMFSKYINSKAKRFLEKNMETYLL